MKIAICDDLHEANYQLLSCINTYCQTNLINAAITEYDSGEALLDACQKDVADIIFLDIYMDGLNGIETARKIREIDQDCLLVFVTTSREHALDGFAVNALHYLVKPITDDKIAEVFQRCHKILALGAKYIEVISERLLVKILVKTIYFIEVYDKVALVHTDSEVIKTYMSLDEFAKQLDTTTFLRCHRSYIVNMRYIVNVADNDFILQSGEKVPIRQADKQALKQIYMDYLFSLTREE